MELGLTYDLLMSMIDDGQLDLPSDGHRELRT
jgi:hypothetical protein